MNKKGKLAKIAKRYGIFIPDITIDKTKRKVIIDCFKHSCEYGIFPYITKEERADYEYWFPIYFDMLDTGCCRVYLINLHPEANVIYAGRTIYEGNAEKVSYYTIRENIENASAEYLPKPEDLKKIKSVHIA